MHIIFHISYYISSRVKMAGKCLTWDQLKIFNNFCSIWCNDVKAVRSGQYHTILLMEICYQHLILVQFAVRGKCFISNCVLYFIQRSGKLSSIVPFPLSGPIPKIDGDEYRAFKVKRSDEVGKHQSDHILFNLCPTHSNSCTNTKGTIHTTKKSSWINKEL